MTNFCSSTLRSLYFCTTPNLYVLSTPLFHPMITIPAAKLDTHVRFDQILVLLLRQSEPLCQRADLPLLVLELHEEVRPLVAQRPHLVLEGPVFPAKLASARLQPLNAQRLLKIAFKLINIIVKYFNNIRTHFMNFNYLNTSRITVVIFL